ncbi:MAG: hypothetical protein LBN93_10460 [Candidatus Symbiothrix sp.]|jgi:hypothetical protein|nr:hypothetical protein [Candidatus Symbiothrix sp.]
MLKNILKNIAKVFVPNGDNGNVKVNKPGELTRQQLVDQIVEHFRLGFAEETTDESMLYPTSFNIVLHPDDYAKRQQGFAQSAKDSAKKFHEFLKGKLVHYPDHIPHATYWHFQFSSYDDKENVAGEAIIMSTLYSTDFSAADIKPGANIRATIKPVGSLTTESYNMNKDALLGMDVVNKDQFRINFDKDFGALKSETIRTNNIQDMEDNAYAILQFKEGPIFKSYFMIDPQIEISGVHDTRTGTKFLKLNSDEVINGHVMIKFETNAFKIAAFGDTKLNSRPLTLSQGGDIVWYDLAKLSSLLINDSLIVDFKANKKDK